jgi:hypothetical protein
MIEMYDEKLERKLKVERLGRCMNCRFFVSCREDKKENIEDCGEFRELSSERQVVVIGLEEYCKLMDLEKKAEN